eukprot:TRINITY_DN2066_c0_g2_i1.p1 TRINITY_DN2066_c0_g2~~TRINITY_DN2066_c0_g2_i1.p1  ORF type:complete len:207 (-),score=58.82 TRINITY_DN2066_c0_g2_i1:230-850(-)
MRGSTAVSLVEHIKSTPGIPVFRTSQVQKTIQEIQNITSEVSELYQLRPVSSPSSSSSSQNNDEQRKVIALKLLILYNSIERNKRCILAYLNERMKRLQNLRFHSMGILPLHLKRKLSTSEEKYFSEFADAFASYQNEIDLDISCYFQPPKTPHIKIEVMEDLGTIMLEDGSDVTLNVGNVHYLPRRLVETLIMEGKVKHVPSKRK